MPQHSPPGHLLLFGAGYSARRVADRLLPQGWTVSGTTRSRDRASELEAARIRPLVWSGDGAGETDEAALSAAIGGATHALQSVPPGPDGDPVLQRFRPALTAAAGQSLRWMGLLSTTGVYGEHRGDWVDERTPPGPGFARTRARVAQEEAWAAWAQDAGITLQVFRLSGIYGPGRSVLDRLRAGTARRIVKPGAVSNRIHVDDIADAVVAGIHHPALTGVFNLSDDLPAPPDEVMVHGASLLGLDPPPAITLEEAGLSPVGLSFWAEDRRVRSVRVRSELGYDLRYPTYREGLSAILAEERRR